MLAELYWSPRRQTFSVDGEAVAWDKETKTAPAHDLAHAVVALCGNDLAWKPAKGEDRVQSCHAEFNAVAMENVYWLILAGIEGEDAIIRLFRHLKNFVSVEYDPFPITWEEAIGQFVEGIRPDHAAMFAPAAWLMQRHRDLTQEQHRLSTYRALLETSDHAARCVLEIDGERSEFTFDGGRVFASFEVGPALKASSRVRLMLWALKSAWQARDVAPATNEP